MASVIPTSAFHSAVCSQTNTLLFSLTAAALPKTPFLAPSNLALAVAKPSIRIASLRSRNCLQVRCQEKQGAVVLRENRWMYEESEINGPVIPPSLAPCFLLWLQFSYNAVKELLFSLPLERDESENSGKKDILEAWDGEIRANWEI